MARRRPYTISEASKRLGITPESVLEAVKKGRIKGELKTVLVPKKVWQLSPKSVETYEVSTSHQQRGLKNP
jgi:DNA-binding Lrp family transcriptional regulator